MVTGIPSTSVIFVKRTIDIAIGFVGTLIFLAVYPIFTLLIKLDSKGPVLYKQERVGRNSRSRQRRKNTAENIVAIKERRSLRTDRRGADLCGKVFTLYKFRTMRIDAEKNGPQLCQSGCKDPRITKLGRWLRYFHVDELPQFWNIFIGEMSLIGPRPERPFFTKKYLEEVPHYPERMRFIKPGLTGLAQITLGYDESLQTVNHKHCYDLTYRLAATFFSSWLRMETWIILNTFLYLGYQLKQSSRFFKRPSQDFQRNPNALGYKTARLHIAHPWKLIARINSRQKESCTAITDFLDEFSNTTGFSEIKAMQSTS